MKHGRLRSIQVAAQRQKEEEQQKARHQAEIARRRAPVNEGLLGPNPSAGVPKFVSRGYYEDLPFVCKDCGQPEIWTARQQKWWYETAKGDVWTTALRCRPCRRKERERRAKARAVHLAGLVAKGRRSG